MVMRLYQPEERMYRGEYTVPPCHAVPVVTRPIRALRRAAGQPDGT